MRALVSAIPGLLVLVLAGCVSAAPVQPSTATFVGTYRHGDTTLVLGKDGTFTLSDAPSYTGFTDTDGVWDLSPDRVNLTSYESQSIESVFFDAADGRVLYFGLDLGTDNPRCFQLARKGSGISPLGRDQCELRP